MVTLQRMSFQVLISITLPIGILLVTHLPQLLAHCLTVMALLQPASRWHKLSSLSISSVDPTSLAPSSQWQPLIQGSALSSLRFPLLSVTISRAPTKLQSAILRLTFQLRFISSWFHTRTSRRIKSPPLRPSVFGRWLLPLKIRLQAALTEQVWLLCSAIESQWFRVGPIPSTLRTWLKIQSTLCTMPMQMNIPKGLFSGVKWKLSTYIQLSGKDG